MTAITSHRDLDIFKNAMKALVFVYSLFRFIPRDERYASLQQVRRSAAAVCANIAEAWRKRRYDAHFMSKLTDAEAEAAETQVWLEVWWQCGYITEEQFNIGFQMYEVVLKQASALAKTMGLKHGTTPHAPRCKPHAPSPTPHAK